MACIFSVYSFLLVQAGLQLVEITYLVNTNQIQHCHRFNVSVLELNETCDKDDIDDVYGCLYYLSGP